MAYLALSPVSVAIYGKLNVAGLTALVTGVYDDVPQGVALPFVWYEVRETETRGFGAVGMPTVELRVHVFSRYEGASEAQSIGAKVIELLRDQALTVTGYSHAGRIFYDETVLLPNEDLDGVKVRELVALFRVIVEEA